MSEPQAEQWAIWHLKRPNIYLLREGHDGREPFTTGSSRDESIQRYCAEYGGRSENFEWLEKHGVLECRKVMKAGDI